ncbi:MULTISPECIES: transcription/translation regulatory transformer protein RfaH [Pseudomonas]|uniref:Transcription/translation regulatory transformer protein RfaH n=1 Tax=Pseudomonas eucalypticola TaxID=2599595 RepID=A0A7D5DD06_9PSED|nr:MULTISPECIES: transcription/translation regulatory transformer protein RfaH [Pseudomonas]QKZ07101.1 transcription/translation regulatory transformer protein RfaH [Pseudomonas eucalypticola]
MSYLNDSSNWYLIQTKPRQEARAEEHLARQHFECFRPLKPALDKPRKAAEEELFPGYLFIRLDQGDSWYPIRSTRGVCRIVAFGGAPCPVPDSLIAQIRRRLATPEPQPSFNQGEAVLVHTGGSDIQAIFLSDDGQERAVILLNLLQREQRISLPKSSLSRMALPAC